MLLPACEPAALPAPADNDAELRIAARSPYLIKRFFDSHESFTVDALWTALHVPPATVPRGRCTAVPPETVPRGRCTAVLIAVPISAEPQVILRLDFGDVLPVFLRFDQSTGPGGKTWKLAGFFAAFAHYFSCEHHLISLGGRPFLLVSDQAEAGTGLSVKRVSGFDLGRRGFKPAFAYVAEGHMMRFCDVNRDVSGYPYSFEKGPVEKLRIHYRVRYFTRYCTNNRPSDDEIELGSTSADAVYTRTGDADFKLDPSSTNAKEIEVIYWNWDPPGLSDEDFLRYNFENLNRIASGPANRRKRWLTRFLADCVDTPERRRLVEAIRRTRLAQHRP
jgi:hypothetical protein